MGGKYIKVFVDFETAMQPLGDAERGRLFTAMLKYAGTNELPDLRGNERFVWPTAKMNIDRDTEAYERKVQNARDSVDKRASTQAYASVRKRTQTHACVQDEDKDKDKDEDKDSEERNAPSGRKESSAKPRFTPPTVEAVAAYCVERGNGIDANQFVDFYTAKGWRVGNQPMKDWKAAVRTWEVRDRRTRQEAGPRRPVYKILE